MLDNSALLYLAGQQASEQIDNSFDLQRAAARRFWRLFAGSVWQRVRSLFGRRPAGLLPLKQVEAQAHGSRYLGAMAVPISQIQGSEGKSEEFDAAFRPLKPFSRDRWVSVAVAFMQGKALPPVELIKVGRQYFVRDGHHRISVARAYGQYDVDAVVTDWN
jgi:hypothetical protein